MNARLRTSRLGAALRALTALALLAVGLASGGNPAYAANYTAISGSGSSWASVALDAWSSNLRRSGIVINYNPDGSAAGRSDYIQNQDDFAGSDPPFRNGADELAGTGAEKPEGYSYVPDTAGGTAFMYHLTVGGKLIKNLRLSPKTLFGIFTGAITNWDDGAITHDYGKRLPSLPITPVIRSDGSGATYFLTRWFSHMFRSQWNSFCQRVHPGVKLPCPQTEFYPQFGSAKAENGSTNVAAYITSSYGNGAIGYDEYAYAKNANYPVVKVLNPGGYYVLPSASNVAVALTAAKIDEKKSSPNFLQQDLDGVYTFKDPRSYPLASYSYLIVPRLKTTEPRNFTTSKGHTLSTFVDFLLCAGQSYKYTATLGYSPLPLNLVQGGLLQSDNIPGHIAGPNLNTLHGCGNPTFTNGKLTLLLNAPYPSKCDKLGASLDCTTGGNRRRNGSGGHGSSGGNSSNSSGQGANSSGSGTGGTGGAGTGGVGTGTGAGGVGTGAVQPGATGPVSGVSVSLASDQTAQTALGVLTALAIIAAVVVPPTVAMWWRRRRGQAHG
jgi:ABC-type phosphate transport system substrate-binding protein